MLVNDLAYEQLKARAGNFTSNNAEFKSKDLTIVSENQEKFLKHWLTEPVNVTFLVFRTYIPASNFSRSCFWKHKHQITSLLGSSKLRVFGNTTHSTSTN